MPFSGFPVRQEAGFVSYSRSHISPFGSVDALCPVALDFLICANTVKHEVSDAIFLTDVRLSKIWTPNPPISGEVPQNWERYGIKAQIGRGRYLCATVQKPYT